MPPDESPGEPWRKSLVHAHELLERWLRLFDGALAEAEAGGAKLPTPDRLAELKNAFGMTKTLLEIEILAHRLSTLKDTEPDHDDILARLESLAPHLLDGDIPESSDDD